MIKHPTVFIVGAGASVGYGFPLGSSLVTRILHGIQLARELRTQLVIAGFREGDLDDFAKKLRASDTDSIDTFLEGNQPEYQRIGKAAIALTILESEGLCRNEELLLSRPKGMPQGLEHIHGPSHWLGHVWNLMRAGASEGNIAGNRISFVVFNYDRVIEHYFDTVLAATYNLDHPSAQRLRKQAIRIVHLHGGLPDDYPFGNYRVSTPRETTERPASGIKIIHDLSDDDRSAVVAFAEAQEWLGDAQLICFLGFGYHPTNIQRLRIARIPGDGRAFYASCYGLGTARRNVTQQLLSQHVHWGDPDAMSAVFLPETVPLQ